MTDNKELLEALHLGIDRLVDQIELSTDQTLAELARLLDKIATELEIVNTKPGIIH